MSEEKRRITEDDHVHDEWYEEAKEITEETLSEFVRHLMHDYVHDYGTVCHAVAACALATAYAGAEKQGITAFQASAVMWKFIRHWWYGSNRIGLTLVDYDHMLYPQDEYYFRRVISARTWELLKQCAAEELQSAKDRPRDIHPEVMAHWQSIVDGVVPFGYTVEEE